jgi:phosphatidylglycerophosphate synthase
MNPKRYSLTEIRQAYEQAEDVDFYRYSIARFVFRPLSYYGAWLFLRIGVTPNQTTFVSWGFVLVGCLLYSLTPPSLWWIPLLMILAWVVLDYMDGSMARVTQTRSKYGHFIDVVGAYFMLAFLPIFLGIGLYRFPEHSIDMILAAMGLEALMDPALILALSAFAALNNILLRLIVMRMQITFGIDPRGEGDGPRGRMARAATWLEALISPRALYFPALILATAVKRLEWFVAFYFIIYTGALIAYTAFYTFMLLPRSSKT